MVSGGAYSYGRAVYAHIHIYLCLGSILHFALCPWRVSYSAGVRVLRSGSWVLEPGVWGLGPGAWAWDLGPGAWAWNLGTEVDLCGVALFDDRAKGGGFSPHP